MTGTQMIQHVELCRRSLLLCGRMIMFNRAQRGKVVTKAITAKK